MGHREKLFRTLRSLINLSPALPGLVESLELIDAIDPLVRLDAGTATGVEPEGEPSGSESDPVS